jgi:hypothetical protein
VRIGNGDSLVVEGLQRPLQSAAQSGLVVNDEDPARRQLATCVNGVR